jgi:hypothetical protein
MIHPSCTPTASNLVDKGLEPVVSLSLLLSPYHGEPPQLAFHEFHLGDLLELALLGKLIQRGSRGEVKKVLTRDGNSSVHLASQGHCAGVFIGT